MKYIKDVQGLSCNMHNMMMHRSNVTVMITSDKLGETMSISDSDKMITIPLESVKDILRLRNG